MLDYICSRMWTQDKIHSKKSWNTFWPAGIDRFSSVSVVAGPRVKEVIKSGGNLRENNALRGTQQPSLWNAPSGPRETRMDRPQSTDATVSSPIITPTSPSVSWLWMTASHEEPVGSRTLLRISLLDACFEKMLTLTLFQGLHHSKRPGFVCSITHIQISQLG